MSELFLIGLFGWAVAQGDWLEAAVLAIRWVWMLAVWHVAATGAATAGGRPRTDIEGWRGRWNGSCQG